MGGDEIVAFEPRKRWGLPDPDFEEVGIDDILGGYREPPTQTIGEIERSQRREGRRGRKRAGIGVTLLGTTGLTFSLTENAGVEFIRKAFELVF
jgi:hypothetical protein